MRSTVKEPSSIYAAVVPQLNSGDVLDHTEYLRRYEAAPENLKSERINDKVFLMNALRAKYHGNPHSVLNFWLCSYSMSDAGLVVSDNSTLLLDQHNDPQPDLCMYRIGGGADLNAEGYLFGVPEMIVEIAGSSASYDFGEKRDVYEAAGVGEYLVFETISGQIEWWHHDGNRYLDVPLVEGVHQSVLFPGLWLDGDALRSADKRRLIQTLQHGMRPLR